MAFSNPAKSDPNPSNSHYYSADEFNADVRLVFSNTFKFNRPDHAVTAMGKRLEELFSRIFPLRTFNVCTFYTKFCLSSMFHIQKQAKPVPVKKALTPPPPLSAIKKAVPRRQPTSVPVIRQSKAEQMARPKREIHSPPSKDLPYANAPRKNRKGKKVKDDGTAEQLKYCGKILQELHRKQHYPIASPYEPVGTLP